MALFTNLHQVGDVMVQLLTEGLAFLGDAAPTQVGAPLEVASGPADEIRVTLLWVTPQATHRNDPYEIDATGVPKAPPVSVSAFYLISTYGSSSGEDPQRAHELLGRVLQVFHTWAQVNLPLLALPDVGSGRITFTQLPITPDFVEHVFLPLQVKHRPWVVYEVGPVQLDMLVPASLPGAQVRPGGLRLGGPQVTEPPQLSRLTPSRQAEGAIIRLDVDLKGRALTQVRVGGDWVPSTLLTTIVADRSYLLTLPPGAKQNTSINLRLQVGNKDTDPPVTFSGPETMAVVSTEALTLNAPPRVRLVGVVSLSGRNLQPVTEIMIWPDGVSPEPSQIISIPPDAVTASSVQVSAVVLVAAGVVPGVYRLALRNAAGSITPYVLFEVIP